MNKMSDTAPWVQTPLPPPQHLTVITDEECELCRQCKAWLSEQSLLVSIEFLAVGSAEAQRRYRSMGDRRDVLIVADEYGRIWVGPDAFVMCLWATGAYRGWSRWAARPGWNVVAKALFNTVSSNRHQIADMMSGRCTDQACDAPTHSRGRKPSRSTPPGSPDAGPQWPVPPPDRPGKGPVLLGVL